MKELKTYLTVVIITIILATCCILIGQRRIHSEIHNARLVNTVRNQSDTIVQPDTTAIDTVEILNDTLIKD